MAPPSTSTVDVRDMLCAQALALVAQAVARVRIGESLHLFYSTEDVKQDLVTWARDQHHRLIEGEPATLQLTRGR